MVFASKEMTTREHEYNSFLRFNHLEDQLFRVFQGIYNSIRIGGMKEVMIIINSRGSDRWKICKDLINSTNNPIAAPRTKLMDTMNNQHTSLKSLYTSFSLGRIITNRTINSKYPMIALKKKGPMSISDCIISPPVISRFPCLSVIRCTSVR